VSVARISAALCVAAGVCIARPAGAQCDSASFERFNVRSINPQDAPIDVDSLAIGEGGVVVSLPLRSGAADAGLIPGGGSGAELRVTVRRWVWRLTSSAVFDPTELRVDYTVPGGALLSQQDAASRLAMQVVTSRIDTINQGNRTVFEGHVELWLDPANATRAGRYRGGLEITVDCL
jgi:hypothetical protein